jgi:hypothetical protein
MDRKTVENLRQLYNKEHPSESPIPKGESITVWKAIQKRMKKVCDDGVAQCVLNGMMAKPKAPGSWEKNPEEWLSSLDIEGVEKQFMKVFPDYTFLGCVPIDFDKKSAMGTCVVDALCSLRIDDLHKQGYDKIGIVFNTDVNTGPGKHWVSLFANIGEEYEYPRITYFDSYSQQPEPEIQRLMGRWKQQWDATGINSKPMELTYNKTRHQYQDSECGMYCLYFHYACLMGIPMEKRVPDDVVRAFRGVLFSIGKK